MSKTKINPEKKVQKFLDQVGVEITEEGDQEFFRKIFDTDDRFYSIWKNSLVKFVEKIIKQ
jgi:hypothetical protein